MHLGQSQTRTQSKMAPTAFLKGLSPTKTKKKTNVSEARAIQRSDAHFEDKTAYTTKPADQSLSADDPARTTNSTQGAGLLRCHPGEEMWIRAKGVEGDEGKKEKKSWRVSVN